MDITNHIKQQLQSFEPTSLSQLEKVQLMDREDSKSFFHMDALPDLIKAIQPDYYVLEVNNSRIFQYETLYFDTPDLLLYQSHHNGRLARHKLRYRKYVDSDLTFFEIKTKTNKGRNVKTRIKVKEISSTLYPECIELIQDHTNLVTGRMQPVLSVFVSRITFVSKDFLEKATLDLNIEFYINGRKKDTEGLVIAEVKQDRYSARSQFLKAQHQYRIYPNNISKYCLGILGLYNHVKYNRFKPRLLKLNKITKNSINFSHGFSGSWSR